MKFITKTGFTLIELLVVITIIGILATGATTVYTSQIQKARDSVRLQDIKALQAGVEQVYQDSAEYPAGDDFWTWGTDSLTNPIAWVQTYVPKIPSDPKFGQNCNNNGGTDTTCAYTYGVFDDGNGITNGAYEISTAFEWTWNITWKAANTKDGWNDPIRLEFWLDINTNNTSLAGGLTSLATSSTIPPTSDNVFVIWGQAIDIP